jgi:hypothetical protein
MVDLENGRKGVGMAALENGRSCWIGRYRKI